MNRPFHRAITPILALSLSLAGGSSLVLAQEKQSSTEELTNGSDLVAVGRIRGKEAAWDAQRSRIETTVTMEVDEYLKGSAGRTITIITPGGEVGGVGELYSHAARFEKDEEVVVFVRKDLDKRKKERFQISGGTRGKETIKRDEETGERTVGGKRRFAEFQADVKKAASKPRH